MNLGMHELINIITQTQDKPDFKEEKTGTRLSSICFYNFFRIFLILPDGGLITLTIQDWIEFR